jgi:hypothetical protein
MLKQIISLFFLFICLSITTSAAAVSSENYDAAVSYVNSNPGNGILTCSDSSDYSTGTYMYCFQLEETQNGYLIILTDPISKTSFSMNLSCFVEKKHVHFFDTEVDSPNRPIHEVDGLQDNYLNWID